MNISNKYFKEDRNPGIITLFLWWSAGADSKILKQCFYSDYVKYFGLGGIVFANTGESVEYPEFYEDPPFNTIVKELSKIKVNSANI